MSNLANSRSDSSATFSFTLPISCQICLGKVKQPVVCPNHHVFCKTCMELWLDHSPQCPACRVPITTGIPILGGLASQEETEERFSCKELRKARVELLFKEYETELERLQSENQMLQLENRAFREQLRASDAAPALSEACRSSACQSVDLATVSRLTKKLDDATLLYERVKKELGQLKRENNALKDENVTMQRASQNLRLELQSRSPRKYGRTTVAVLQKRVESYEKEISQLKKALERSDSYIEDVEKELDSLRAGFSCSVQDGSKAGTLVAMKQGESFALESQSIPSFRTDRSDDMNNSERLPGRDLVKGHDLEDTTFDLEVPSPFHATSTSAGQSSVDGDQGHLSTSKGQCYDGSVAYGDTGKCRKKLRFMSQEKSPDLWKEPVPKISAGNTHHLGASSEDCLKTAFCVSTVGKIGESPDRHNVSVTSEIEDCLRLFDEAEKNIEKRRGAPGFASVTASLPQTSSASGSNSLAILPQNSGGSFPAGNQLLGRSSSQASTSRQGQGALNRVPEFSSGNTSSTPLLMSGQLVSQSNAGHSNIRNSTDQAKVLSRATGLSRTSGSHQGRMPNYNTQ